MVRSYTVPSVRSVSETGENIGPTPLFPSLKSFLRFLGLSSNCFCSAFLNDLSWSQAVNISLFCIIIKPAELGSGNLSTSHCFS